MNSKSRTITPSDNKPSATAISVMIRLRLFSPRVTHDIISTGIYPHVNTQIATHPSPRLCVSSPLQHIYNNNFNLILTQQIDFF